MAELILRTEFGDFDLFGSEDIVQTSAIFNLENITARYGEYSNEFNLPLTTNNQRIIRHANFITSVNTLPYERVEANIVIDGLNWKNGYIEITSIQETIKCKFFTGNTVFYDKIKSKFLTDLDWSDFNHDWNYTNAVASSNSTEGFIYPVIDYNGSITGDTVDVRKILPATYCKETLNRIASDAGYSIEYNFDTSDLDVALLPFSKKNPGLEAALILANSVDVSATNDYQALFDIRQFGLGFNQYFFQSAPLVPGSNVYGMKFNAIDTPGSSGNFNFTTQKFTTTVAGTYDYTSEIEFSLYDYIQFTFNLEIGFIYYVNTLTRAHAIKNGVEVGVFDLATGLLENQAYPTGTTVIPPIPQTINATSITGSVYLDAGDTFEVVLSYDFNGRILPKDSNPPPLILTASINPVISVLGVGNTLDLSLQNALSFGNLITYSSVLPKIKCSDFLRDQCVRFGLIVSVDEERKIVSLNKLEDVSDNIDNPYDWSDKLDETNLPEVKFKYSSYGQSNNLLHAIDKTVTSIPDGTNYVLTINNENLDPVKDLYTSPFAPSEIRTYNGHQVAYIPIYNVTTGKFDTDIVPRICFSEMLTGEFKFTDGTSTSGFIDAARVWFIDQNLPDLSMGFGVNLINKNSKTLVNSLQSLKLVKANFNLSLIDLFRIDYFRPVYVSQFQAYFFISSINQFNYTNPGLTEVELIKLN